MIIFTNEKSGRVICFVLFNLNKYSFQLKMMYELFYASYGNMLVSFKASYITFADLTCDC